jgi:hypothetical protein
VVNPNSVIDNDVPEEERMKIHRRVTLSTEHLLRLFRQSWSTVQASSASTDKTGSGDKNLSSVLRARKELMQGLGLPLKDPDRMINRDTGQWSIDRYQLAEEVYATPVVFRANIAYDFLDAEDRKVQQKQLGEMDDEIAGLEALGTAQSGDSAEAQVLQDLKTKRQTFVLAEPWKNPNFYLELNHQGYTLSTTAVYSIYLRTATSFSAGLGLPPFYGTSVGIGYSLGKEYLQQEGDFKVTSQRSLALTSLLTSSVTANVALDRKVTGGLVESYTDSIRLATGFSYASPSQCWGLQALRVKEFGVDDQNASYTLQLSMVFMGQQRSLPNMSSGLIREIREEPSTPQS